MYDVFAFLYHKYNSLFTYVQLIFKQERYKLERKFIQEEGEQKRAEVEMSLKPILGAPANKNILISLNNLAGKTNCRIVKRLIRSLNKFKVSSLFY